MICHNVLYTKTVLGGRENNMKEFLPLVNIYYAVPKPEVEESIIQQISIALRSHFG